MARKSKLSTLPVKTLLKMRDEIVGILSRKAADLQRQLSALNGGPAKTRKTAKPRKAARPRRKGKAVTPQFRSRRDPNLVWSGRGMTPRWMREEMQGTKLTKESFRIKS